MEFACEIDIDAPAERVFPWLEEPARMQQWVQGLEHSESLAPVAAPAVGTRFRQRMREMGRTVTYDGEVIRREPPTALEVVLTHRRFEMCIAYRLGACTPGTHLRYALHLRALDSTVARMERALGWMLERGARQQLLRLKRCVEDELDSDDEMRKSSL
ncbi:MAG TPA: SRPBCC family protein [Candidatus Acidoferrales bacterium]|nr:SRPBCC family protein [Candidatus Acidoferrales bacterium]